MRKKRLAGTHNINNVGYELINWSLTTEEVGEQVALVHLVEDDHRVLRKQLVGGQLAKEQTLRKKHDAGVLCALAIEANLNAKQQINNCNQTINCKVYSMAKSIGTRAKTEHEMS